MLDSDNPKYKSGDSSILSASGTTGSNSSSVEKAKSTFFKRDVNDVSLTDSLKGTKETLTGYNDSISQNAVSIRSTVQDYWAQSNSVRTFLTSLDFSNPVSGLLSTLSATEWLESAGISASDLNKIKDIYNNSENLSMESLSRQLSDVTGISVIGGGTKFMADISNTNWSDLNSILSLTGNILGIPNLKTDISSVLTSVSADLISILYGVGLDGLADQLADKYGDDKGFIKQLTDRFETYCYLGNLQMINKCIDYIGSENARARVPNAEEVILRAYNYQEYNTKVNLVNNGNELYNTLCRFSNPFPSYELGLNEGTVVTGSDLTPFVYASDHSKKVLIAINKFIIELEIAPSYPSYNMLTGTLSLYRKNTITGL